MSLNQHLARHADEIQAEAEIYARTYGVPMAKAIADVRDAYTQGWYEACQDDRTATRGEIYGGDKS